MNEYEQILENERLFYQAQIDQRYLTSPSQKTKQPNKTKTKKKQQTQQKHLCYGFLSEKHKSK